MGHDVETQDLLQSLMETIPMSLVPDPEAVAQGAGREHGMDMAVRVSRFQLVFLS